MAEKDRRECIVRAAKELIANKGFHGAPMTMIAGHANVGAGTIYRYFENKDFLITELYKDLEERMYLSITGGYTESMQPHERFLHLGKSLLIFFISNPLDFRYLEQFHNSPYGAAHRRDKILVEHKEGNVFRKLFEDGVSLKILKSLPLVLLFSIAFGPLRAAARDHILGFIELDDALIHRVIDACWDGIKLH